MNSWIPVVVQIGLGLLTIAGSGIVSGVVTHKLNARKDKLEFKRSKLEALFAAVLEYDQLSATCMMAWAYAMHGYIPAKEAQERHENETKDKPDYYGTAEMLVNLYFPELLPDFLAIKTSSEKTRAIQMKYLRASEAGNDTSMFLDPFLASIKALKAASLKLEEMICQRGREENLLA